MKMQSQEISPEAKTLDDDDDDSSGASGSDEL